MPPFGFLPFPRPRVGLAVSERRLVGVRKGGVSLRARRELPDGLVVPSMVAPNIRSVSELAQLAEGLLDELSAGRRPVALALPDLAISTALYPSTNGAPERRLSDDVGSSLPFPMSEARHDFWRGRKRETLAAVVRDAVVRQYEEAVEATGCRLGWVDGASLAKIPSWAARSSREPFVSAQVQLYPTHYCLSVMRSGELLDLRTKLRASDDITAVRKELLRIPALYEVSALGSIVLLGDDAMTLAEELSHVLDMASIQIEEDNEEGQLASSISALLDRPQP